MAKKPSYEELRRGVNELEQEVAKFKRTEEASPKSEEIYRDLFESNKDGIVLTNMQGKIVDTNKTYADMLGYEMDEVRKLTYQQLTPEKWHNMEAEIVENQFIKRGYCDEFEKEYIKKDGTVFPISLKGWLVRDEQGRPIGMWGFVRDITDRKRAEKALQESKQFSENLIACMKDGFSVLDNKGVHLNVNPAFSQMTGFMREELIGTGSPHLYWPEEEYAKIETALQEALRGASEDFELIFKRKNGERFPVIVSPAQILDKKGNVTNIFATVKDITARKLSEEALRVKERAIESSINAVAFADFGAKLTYVNKAFLRLWGYDSDREVLGRPAVEFWKQPEKALEVVDVLSSKGSWVGELVARKSDGSQFHAQLSASMVTGGASEPFYMMCSFLDISERKQAERALRKKDAELETKAKNLEEVNTALRVLLKSREEDKGELEEKVMSNVKDLVFPYLEKLKKTPLDSNQKSCVDILESNLNDIISPFSRKLSSRYLGLTPTEIRVANLIKDGKTTKEIAGFMNVSGKTIEFHRDSIRNKLGLKHRKVNLRTHLLTT